MVSKKQPSFASIPSSTFLLRKNVLQIMSSSTQSFSEGIVAKPQSLHSVQTINQRPTITSRKNLELPLFFDRCFDKNRIKTFIGWLLANFGENATVYIVEKLKNLGFHFATEAGISLSIDDLQVPLSKNWFLSQAEKDIRRNHNNFQCGNLTPVEQSQQLLDRWHQTSEILRESVIQSFRLTNTLNPVYMMAFSGARGNISQVRQLVGMRGLMADPQGQIISFPIRSNFREGLTLTEYVISCYGARKGVVDTALRTADSGYLTRRLVDVSQHVVVWTFDCKTDAGIHLTEMKEGKKIILSLKKRILGRVLAQEIPTIAFRNQQISAQLAQQIASLREHVLVRSPLSCSVPNSVCQLCYGWSLSRGRIVSLGEAVGVIAAQSIGEPGTQLTMRTFHTGGVFSGDVIDEIRAPHDGLVHFLQPLLGQLIRTSHGKIAYLTRASGGFLIEKNLTEKKAEHFVGTSAHDRVGRNDPSQHANQTLINLEPGTALFVRQGEKVIAKQLLAEYSSISAQTKERVEAQHQVYSDQKGEIFFDDVVLGKKLKKEEPEAEKASSLNLQNKFKHDSSQEDDASTKKLFDGGPFLEQNIQKIDPQSGRKIDIVTSLKLNTLWVLSGTLFEPPIFSPLYTKIGDLVDKTTLLTLIQNELNLQTPHLEGEYVLSAQLKKNKITKRKEKLLTFFRKNLVSNKLPRILQSENLEGDRRKRDSLFLNEFSLNLTITNIKYKKSGYFFTNSKKEELYNFYSLFLQLGSVNLFNNLINFRNYKENSKDYVASSFLQSEKNWTKMDFASFGGSKNWNLIFGKDKTNFPSGVFLQGKKIENIVIKQEHQFFVRKEINRFFVLAEPKQIETFLLKVNRSKIIRNSFGKQDFRIFIPKYSKESAKAKDLWWRSHNLGTPYKPSIEDQLSVESCFKTKTNLVNLSKRRRVPKKSQSFLTENLLFTSHFVTQNIQKLGKNKKNVNHFFTTTSLSQPFSNRREFKNEFVLQWFSPYFKTETEGLIYTTNYYCNKRSSETHIFLIAEENYGKKNLGKMNFGRRKKSFNVVSFKELMAPSICLANVLLSGKKKPSSSFKNFLTSLSEDFVNILSINRRVEDKTKKLSFPSHSNITHKNGNSGVDVFNEIKKEKPYNNFIEPIGGEATIAPKAPIGFSDKTYFDKNQLKRTFVRDSRAISINSLLSETFFSQNESLKKELFFLRKKENLSLYSVCFHSTKTETLNSTVNFLRKGFLSFKNKWVETDIPLGYQKNLQGSQIPFYSTENGVLKNNLTPSFFTNQYSNYWARKKSKKLSGSFLKDFFSLTFKYPFPYVKIKKRNLDAKKVCLIDNLYLNKNEFLGRNDILVKNFNKKPINEKLYQKEFWLANQERKTLKAVHFVSQNEKEIISKSPLRFNQVKTKFSKFLASKTDFAEQNVQKSSFLCSKQKRRFYLAPLLTKLRLNLGKKKVLKFNPFPSKGNYLSSAFIFRINMKAISFSDLQKQSSLFYNPYPYSQPVFLEFLQNKSTANFHYLTKSLKTDLDLQDKHIVLQSKTLFSKRSLLGAERTKLLQSLDFQESKSLRSLALQAENSDHLTEVKINLQNKYKKDSFALHSAEQGVEREKQGNSLKNLKVLEDYRFPQNIISCNTNNSENQSHHNKKFNKFSSFLQKQIKKISTKKHKKTVEKLQRLNLQIRPGWLYLPKDQSQTAKAHQSFIPPFQQNIDEILFDQFPVYIESILRKNFEEQLVDKYLQPSTNAVDFYKTKTLLEKSKLQKFINQISTVSKRSKQSGKGLKVSRERSNKFLLSLRETFWRGSTFSSFVENDFTTSHYNNKSVSKLAEKDSLCEISLPTNFLKHIKISNRSSFLSFLLRNKKERKNEKFLFLRPVLINPVKIVFQVVTNKFCRFNSIQSFALSCINDVNFDFSQDFFSQSQIIDKKFNQDNTCIENKVNPGFSLCLPQISRIYFVKNKPFSDFILVPQKLNFQPVKIKSYIFSDKKPISYKSEDQVSKPFLKEKQDGQHTTATGHGGFAAIAGGHASQKGDTSKGNKQHGSEIIYPTDRRVKDTITEGHNFVEKTSKSNHNDRIDQIKSKEQDVVERLTLSEKNKDLICSGRQILISINNASKMLNFGEVKSKASNKDKNLFKILQNKAFLIESFSTKVDTDYSSFLILIPNSLKNKKSGNIVTTILSSPEERTKFSEGKPEHSMMAKPQSFFKSIVPKIELPQDMEQNGEQIRNAVFDETPSFERKKPSFYEFFREKSKLWLLIRKVAEYPLLDTSIFQQKTRLYKENQTFFEKELIYSSTPLSLYLSNRITFSSKFNKQKKKEVYLSFYHSPKVSLKIRESLFYLLDTFSKLEKQDFTNLRTDFTKNAFGTFYETKCKNKIKFGDFNDTKIKEDKLKLPLNLFPCQKMFWQIFDLYRQNVQKNKFFEGKQLLFINKIFDTEKKNPLLRVAKNATESPLDRRSIVAKPPMKRKVSSQGSQFFYKITVENRTWSFQKENLQNIIFPQEKEQTIIRSFKQSYLLHFFLNLNISKQSPLQRIEIKTTFKKIEGSTQTSSCAHYLNSEKIQTSGDFRNYPNIKIGDLNLQKKKTEYLQKDDILSRETWFLQSKNLGQSKFSAFPWLNINKINFVEQNLLFSLKNQSFAEKLRTLSRKNLNSPFYHKIEKDLLHETSTLTEQSTLRDQVFRQNFQHFIKQNVTQSRDQAIFDNIKPKFFSEKSKFASGFATIAEGPGYSFTPFARDLSLTLSFIAKLNQSWFFSLTNNVKNKTKTFESFTFQGKKLKKRVLISTSKTQLNEKNRKQEYLKDKKSISKESISYPLKEKSSYTTLLLDQTITTHDKTPVATTAIMSREEGEIENLKNKSASLILKNSDIEILLTKNERPLLVVGQLIRYGEQIANGIAAPKSGQIIQVDSNKVTLRKAQPILFPRGGSVDVNHGDYVKEGSPLLSLSYQRLVTGDIVQGIPKIEQLFEARETEGGQPLLSSLHSELEAIFLSYSTQLGLKLAVRESFKEIQQIIVDRVQRVYIAQGVLIADKHFEVVIRQMTSKVRILDGGRPGFLYGELVDLRRVELLNAGVPFANEQAIYEPIILGISKACLEAEGFLSPASFQETTRVLSLAAIERKTDFLRGIKERVILGDVIQAGTGFALYDRPIRKIKQEECMDLSLSVLHNAHLILSTNQYYKQL